MDREAHSEALTPVSGEIVAAHAPEARVVKVFNAIRMEHYDKGSKFHDGKRVIFVSGDDKEAKAD